MARAPGCVRTCCVAMEPRTGGMETPKQGGVCRGRVQAAPLGAPTHPEPPPWGSAASSLRPQPLSLRLQPPHILRPPRGRFLSGAGRARAATAPRRAARDPRGEPRPHAWRWPPAPPEPPAPWLSSGGFSVWVRRRRSRGGASTSSGTSTPRRPGWCWASWAMGPSARSSR